jgi:hypothetical protein
MTVVMAIDMSVLHLGQNVLARVKFRTYRDFDSDSVLLHSLY